MVFRCTDCGFTGELKEFRAGKVKHVWLAVTVNEESTYRHLCPKCGSGALSTV